MTEYGRKHTDGSRSGGQPITKTQHCPNCEATEQKLQTQYDEMGNSMLKHIGKAAEEIVRLELENDGLKAENERLTYNGIHSCHDQCERPLCVVERENEKLREAMTWIKNNSDNRSVHYRVAREALGETK